MKLLYSYAIVLALLTSFSGLVTAKQLESKRPVLLYAPLIDHVNWSDMMVQSQLTITPRETYAVRAIQITTYDSQDGTCSGPESSYEGYTNPWVIDNGVGVIVMMIKNSSYRTTNASNYALFQDPTTFSPSRNDTLYQLLDVNFTPIGGSGCVAASPDLVSTCDDPTDCGWSSPRFWTP